MPASTAPRCEGSNSVQSQSEGEWATAETSVCNSCRQRAKFRVRGTDLPPWGRVMPHRTDGTPTR